MEKVKAKIDVAVLILFFCRDKQLAQVFAAVKEARPSRLYLCQDGPRGPQDMEGILKCREIVKDENIDWECEVHRWYREENMGCDPSTYRAQKWLFEHEEMGIILEDDIVASQSFFPFCKELLEKYKDDTRVSLICGMNDLGISNEVEDSYFFTKDGGIWGWATWRRFIDTWDPEYTWMDDPEKCTLIKSQLNEKVYSGFMHAAKWHRDTGIPYFETLYSAAQWLSDGYAIVPKYNLISNVGVSEHSAHGSADLRTYSSLTRKLFYMKTYLIDFPLKHPAELKRNFLYEKKKVPSDFAEWWAGVEHIIRVLIFQGPGVFWTKAKKKLGIK